MGFSVNGTTKIGKTLLQPFQFSALDVIKGGHHLGVEVMDYGVALDEFGHAFRMTTGVVINAVRGVDRRFDASGDGHDVVRQRLAHTGGGDCTAAGVTHDNHQESP